MFKPPIEKDSVIQPMSGEAAWDEAFLRVESYLHAHHLESRVLLNHLSTEIIREAREWASASPGEEPVEVAMRATHARIGAWFTRAGYAEDWSSARVRAGGRLALVQAKLPGRWANSFLSSEPFPEDFVRSLNSGILQPGPALQFSNMAAEPLEFSFKDQNVANGPKLGLWPGLRPAAGWLLIMGLYCAAWAASH